MIGSAFRIAATIFLLLFGLTAATWLAGLRMPRSFDFVHKGSLWQIASDSGCVVVNNQPEREINALLSRQAEAVLLKVNRRLLWALEIDPIAAFAGEPLEQRQRHQREASARIHSLRLTRQRLDRLYLTLLVSQNPPASRSISFAIPLTAFAILPALYFTVITLAVVRPRLRPSAHRCPICGYDLRATPDRCPECGTVASRLSAAEQEDPRPQR